MRRRGNLSLVPLCCVVALLSGCVTFEGNRAIVPFFEVYEQPAATGGPGKAAALDADGKPLVAGFARPEVRDQRSEVSLRATGNQKLSREFVFRPFGSLELIGQERRRLKGLWPIIDFAWGAGDARFWVFPVYYYRNRPIPYGEGSSDTDWMVFPFLFSGSDPTEGAYFAVFPLGGKLHGLLAKDEIHFIVFPFYWRTWEGEFDSLHLLWPFFNRVRGGGRTGWRLWPFYGRYRAETSDGRPRHERSFIAWPFYIRQKNNLNTKRPTDLFFTFPFYGRSTNPRTETRTYLWPLFHVARDVETGNKLYFGYLVPYRFTGGQFDLWPLFGWKTRTLDSRAGSWDHRGIAGPAGLVGGNGYLLADDRRTRFRQFALWPIQRYDTDQGETWERTRFWFLPLLWHFHTLRKDTFEITSEWKVWPLWRYRREGARSSFYFPSPVFFRQENPFERQWARLWRLFLYRSGPERSGWEFLYGFLSCRFEEEEESRVFSIFYGLLEWESRRDGHRFRILYLPWR